MLSESTHRSRDIQRELTHVGKIFQISNCTESVSECLQNLDILIQNSTSARIKSSLKSKINLIHELQCVKYMTTELAFDEYTGKIPVEFQTKYTTKNMAVRTFVDSVLNKKSGLPVLIITASNGTRYMMLVDNAGSVSNIKMFKLIDELLSQNCSEKRTGLELVSKYFKMLQELLITAREKAIVIALLALEHSATSIRLNLDIRENVVMSIKDKVLDVLNDLQDEKETVEDTVNERWKKTIEDIESIIKEDEMFLEKKKDSIHVDKKEDIEENIANRKDKLQKMKLNKKNSIRRIVNTELKKWKSKLFRYTKKAAGTYSIDRGAEKAVFDALQEQLVAHKSRTGAPLLERRINRREMRKIANNWLQENGKRLVKSYETVRSWGRPKNKRSIQSRQHRGEGLFSHRKAQKKHADAHINIHYNRAHIKNYTREFFGNKNKDKYKFHVLRRCFDDKAYLRCGTSEGFSRPQHPPLLLHNEQPELPAYDFPEKAGYVAPGVNLLIHDMEESERKGRDVFATKDVTISVTCKPKVSYSSSATNWANDAYRDRIEFAAQHELPIEITGTTELPRHTQSHLVFLKDSLKQFLMMNIKDDFIRCVDGGEYTEREKMRLSVLIIRIMFVCKEIQESNLKDIIDSCQQLVIELQTCELRISSEISAADCELLYLHLERLCSNLIETISPLTPQHKTIDIQTTDAGPGVGTSEKMVRLRLTESFILNDLDLQARFHYAPRDSKSHKVEQVMSALNEAIGDGRFIEIDRKSLMETYTETELLSMTPNDFQRAQEKEDIQVGYRCAQKVSERYNGIACMFTTVHSRVADKNHILQTFFFDEKYMKKCCLATSDKKLKECAGQFYFKYLLSEFDKQYIRYNNGIEGIKVDRPFRFPGEVHRIHPPVPDYTTRETNGSWHYFQSLPDTFSNEYDDLITDTPDQFCPIEQLHQFIDSVGNPNIDIQQYHDSVNVSDRNNTWRKISTSIEQFIGNYTGEDLAYNVRKEAEKMYIQKLKKNSKKLEKLSLSTEELFSVMTGNLKMKVTKTKLVEALPWNGTILNSNVDMTNTCTADNMLFAFHVLQTYREDIRNYMSGNVDQSLSLLYEIHSLFSQRRYPEGKFKWIQQFPQARQQGIWNMWGAEDDYSFCKLNCSTTYKMICTNQDTCKQPVKLMTSRMVCYRNTARSLQEGLNQWFENEGKRAIPCDGYCNDNISRCHGNRKPTERTFVNGPPVLIPLDISNSPWTKMPCDVTFADEHYSLFAVTYGNGGHFNCSIKIQGLWYLYDGLREYHNTGSGLKKQQTQHPLPGYRQSHALYVRNEI